MHAWERVISTRFFTIEATKKFHRPRGYVKKGISVLFVSFQGFASKLAKRHYKHTLKSRVWSAWRSVIESKWKQRVEKACQVNCLISHTVLK